MRKFIALEIMLASLAAAPVAAQVAPYADRDHGIPVMTLRAALQLPPSQLPRVFISPNPYQSYPYNVHETDGLSRNPDDCMRWGCIDRR